MRLLLGIAASVASSLVFPAVAWAQGTPEPAPSGPPSGPWPMMHSWGMEGGWGVMALGPLFMIAWLALLVAVIVMLVRWLSSGKFGAAPTPPTPREILDERFAKGEIDREEYESRRKALGI